jgi:quercetin dioxygenase-like cupin family protein
MGNHVVEFRRFREMAVVRAADARRVETPNAVMTTLASPTQGSASHSVWRVEMKPGQAGPAHTFDAEQIWTVLDGGATVAASGARIAVAAGDTIVLAPSSERRIEADAREGLVAIVAAPPGCRAALSDGTPRGVPAWIE